MSSRRLTTPVPLPLVVAALFALAACEDASGRSAPDPDAAEPAPVRAAAVSREDLARPVLATGVLSIKEEIPLAFKIGGVAHRILVEHGARVRKGDTLAVLDLREIDAAVARARSAADKAARDLARTQRLYADSVATLAQRQDAATADEVARADLRTARFNRQYAAIVAPADGLILRRTLEPGQLVPSGAPVVVLGSLARGMVLRVGLTDRDMLRIRRGATATVRFDAFPGRSFGGTVSEIAAAADPMTGTYTVDLRLPQATKLSAGFVGRAEIRPASTERVTLVPVEALVEADDSTATIVALSTDGRHAEFRQVTLAFLTGDRIAVRRGLEGVSRVITSGAPYLADGQTVRVLP